MQPEDLKRVQARLTRIENMGERMGASINSFYRLLKTKLSLLIAVAIGGVFVMAFSVVKGMRK